MIIYDGDGQILGRLSSIIAKKLLAGERIVVVNVERVVISGRRKSIVDHYDVRVKRGDPHKGPFFPRTPSGIFRRSVRGMLPMKKPKGVDAYKRLRAYTGVPDEFKAKVDTFEQPKAADAARLTTKTINIDKLSVSLGAKKRW